MSPSDDKGEASASPVQIGKKYEYCGPPSLTWDQGTIRTPSPRTTEDRVHTWEGGSFGQTEYFLANFRLVGETVASDAVTGESVNHPAHYNPGPYEAIKVIEAWELGFNLGNAVKYIARAGKKPGSAKSEDLEKALWYLQREIGE